MLHSALWIKHTNQNNFYIEKDSLKIVLLFKRLIDLFERNFDREGHGERETKHSSIGSH